MSREKFDRVVVVVSAGLAALSGCYPAPAAPSAEQDLAHAVQHVTDDLLHQLGPNALATQTTSADPMLDARTGQQTRATQRVEAELRKALQTTDKQLTMVPFGSAGAAQARWLITGTLAVLPEPDRYRMSVALTDRQSGLVIAQAVTPFHQPYMDLAPTKFYQDSPSLVRDRSIDGYMKTAETPRGQPADPLYVQQVPTAALLADALAAYDIEKWDEALRLYTAAAQRQDGQQLRTFNGVYLTNVHLGNAEAAEAAFGKIAALGLATNNLAVKLLFRPGGTDFWPDPKVSALYPMWLRQIARAAQAADGCLEIVGHTSRSGSEQVNDRLSLARATAVRERMEHDAPGASKRWKVTGVGYRENIIGTGSDDERDAIDRRVAFKVIPCAP